MLARDALGEWPSPKDDRQLTNIVLMGMGEPLYNFDNVAGGMKIVMDPEGCRSRGAKSRSRPRGWCR